MHSSHKAPGLISSVGKEKERERNGAEWSGEEEKAEDGAWGLGPTSDLGETKLSILTSLPEDHS